MLTATPTTPPTESTGTRARRRGPAHARPSVAEASDLLALTRTFVSVYLEVEAGRRSSRQLLPLLDAALSPVAALASSAPRGGQRPRRLLRLLGSRTGPCTYDAVAVLAGSDGRCSALALRLRRRGQGWRVALVQAPASSAEPAVVKARQAR